MIELRKGDIIDVRVVDENEKSKTLIQTYEVTDIPRHKRFIVCVLLKNDRNTGLRRAFTALELKENLVWGGNKVKEGQRKAKNIADCTFSELYEYCRKNNINGYYNKDKQGLLRMVREHIKAEHQRTRCWKAV